MADEIIKQATIKVGDAGTTKKTAKGIQELTRDVDDTTAAAKRATAGLNEMNKASSGGTAASRKALANAQNIEKIQHQQFDRSRGVAEASGAAARDFANQSRGLGGLVRLYATFAANLFALGAAFRSLSGAMDTSNMVKGLDQLGAAVGRNLGGLSKELVGISGGAISLAEAMKAVAQTTTGGLSTENIKRLGGVARTASAALGVAMPDAVNRLSRAITKLEPELLDELGIMTRLEPAVDIYARQLGKASSQLTQFERRQAFANAVLAEGEEKFGAIEDIPINAFDVLASSLKDVTQTLATMLNTVLVPVVEVLSSSPAALKTGLAAVIGIIGKQAIPAFGSIKDALELSAVKAQEVATQRVEASRKAVARLKALDDERLAQLQAAADKEIAIQKRLLAEALLLDQRVEAGRKQTPNSQRIAETRRSRLISTATRPTEDLTRGAVAAIQAQSDALKDQAGARGELGRKLGELAGSMTKELDLARDSRQAIRQQTIAIAENSVARKTAKNALEAHFAATKRQIISDTAAIASTDGRTVASKLAEVQLKKLNAEMAAAGVANGFFARQVLKAKVSLAAFAATVDFVSKSIGRLFTAMGVITVFIILFQGLKSVFSGNSEEVEKFNSAIDDAKSASDNMTRSLKLMADKGLKGSIEGIIATANAFDGLATSMKNVVTTAREAQDNATFIDSIEDGIKSLVNSGIEDDLNEQLTNLTLNAIKGLEGTGLKEEGEKQFRDILGINSLDSELNEKTVSEAIESLGRSGQDALVDRAEKVQSVLLNMSSRMESFKTATVAADLAFARLIQSTANTNPIFLLGASMQELSNSMVKVLTSGELVTEQINAIILNISQNPEGAVLYGPETLNNILEVKDGILAVSEAQKKLADIDKTLSTTAFNEFFKDSKEFKDRKAKGIEIVLSDQFITTYEFLTKEAQELRGIIESQEDIATRSADIFKKAMSESFEGGAKLIAQATGQAEEKASLAISKASLVGLTGEERAREQLAISKREIEIQIEAVDTNIQLISSLEGVRATIEADTALRALTSAKENGATEKEIAQLESAMLAAEGFLKSFEDGFSTAGFNKILEGLEGDSKLLLQARGASTNQKVAQQESTKTVLRGNLGAADITGQANILKGIVEDTNKLASAELSILEARKRTLAVSADIAGFTSNEQANTKALLDLDTLRINQAIQNRNLQLAVDTASDGSQSKRNAEILLAKQLITQEEEKQNLLSQIAIDKGNAELSQVNAFRALNVALAEEEFALANGFLDIEQQRNQAAAEQFGLSDSVKASMQQQIDLASLALSTEQARMVVAAELNAIQIQGNAEIQALREQGASEDDIGAKEAKVEREVNAAKANLRTIAATAEQEAKVLEIRTQNTRQVDRQNRLLKTSSSLAADMGKAFGKTGKSIGSLADAFTTFRVSIEKSAGAMEKLLEAQDKLVTEGKTGTKEYADLQQDIALQQIDNSIALVEGFSNAASAAKSFFEEGSTGFKVFSAAEKAFTLVSLALTTQRLISDLAYTQTSVALTGERIGAKVIEAEVDGVAGVVKTIASLPFPANIAAGVAVAAIMTALLASIGGKGPSGSGGPSGFDAEDVQETQGTGLDYKNGVLVNNGGGALGAADEKVEDIANSLELIKDSTLLTSDFGRKSLSVLSRIEANTRSLAATVISSTNILTPESAFGTEEKSSGSFFGKKKTEIIDKGVLFNALLLDLLEGSAIVQEFETLKTTKKKLFGKKKTKFEINTQDLDDSVAEGFQALFSGLIDTAVFAADELVEGASSSIQESLKTFDADFKVSGFELSGEEFSEAILAESNVIINQLVGEALPLLGAFRQLGEGFLGTLLRVASNAEAAETRLGRLGIPLAEAIDALPVLAEDVFNNLVAVGTSAIQSLDSAIAGATFDKKGQGSISEEALNAVEEEQAAFFTLLRETASNFGGIASSVAESLITAQVEFSNAKLAILSTANATDQFITAQAILNNELLVTGDRKVDRRNGVTTEVLEFVQSSEAFGSAVSAMIGVFTDRIGLTIEATTGIVEAFGGVEEFVEKTNFFFENFFTDSEQLKAKTGELNQAFTDFFNEGFISAQELAELTDGAGDLRAEYREIVLAQDLLTDSGIEAANALYTLAPAIVDITDETVAAVSVLDDLSSTIGDFGDSLEGSLSDALSRAIAGDLEQSEIGVLAAEAIEKAFNDAITDAFVGEITATIISQIVTPILTGALNSTIITGALITDITDGIIAKTEQLSKVLNNPATKKAFNQLFVLFSGIITDVAKASIPTLSDVGIGDLVERIAILNDEIQIKILDELIEKERERLDNLQDEANAIQDASREMRDFSNSFIDFKQSLLTSDLSPLTPEEKLAAARSNFIEITNTALDPNTSDADRSLALERVQESASTLLEASRVFFSSSPNFTADFNFVQSTLAELITSTGALASVDDLQLAALNTQIEQSKAILEDAEAKRKILEKADTELEDLNKELDRITALMQQAPSLAAGQFVDSFGFLDKDTSGSLTLAELQASGIATDETLDELLKTLDTNADGELSRFEVINGALGSTSFALQDVADVINKLNQGIITLSQANTQISDIQSANASVGASTFSGSDSNIDITAGGFEFREGNIVKNIASIKDGFVTSIQGESLSVVEAKAALESLAAQIESGSISARSVYETLISFGATADLVARVMGDPVTADGVNAFFKSYDSSIPEFARGINSVPEDMFARIHQGERILPEADNTELMQTLANRRDAKEELVVEVKKLNAQMHAVEVAVTENAVTKEVAEVLGKMLEGNLVNAQAIVAATMQASNEGAEKISKSNGDLAAQEEWRNRSVVEIR